MQKVPYIIVTDPDQKPEVDGKVLVVHFDNRPVISRYGFPVEQVFPIKAVVWECADGNCTSVALSSDPIRLVAENELVLVAAIGFPGDELARLVERFKEVDIRLELSPA